MAGNPRIFYSAALPGGDPCAYLSSLRAVCFRDNGSWMSSKEPNLSTHIAEYNTTGFLGGSGETAALIRAFDWSKTSLGPIERWPQSLRSATSLLLLSPVPMVMLWGPDG